MKLSEDFPVQLGKDQTGGDDTLTRLTTALDVMGGFWPFRDSACSIAGTEF